MSRDAMIEAGAEAVYEAMPVVLKDLVSRAEAEAAIGVPHGVGVPDRWLAAAVLDVVRPLILREAAEAITGHDVARGASAVEAQRWLVGQSREDRVRAILAFAASDLERLADGTNDSAGGEST